jgi:hypothetical protein
VPVAAESGKSAAVLSSLFPDLGSYFEVKADFDSSAFGKLCRVLQERDPQYFEERRLGPWKRC